jgi:hypothetical protein
MAYRQWRNGAINGAGVGSSIGVASASASAWRAKARAYQQNNNVIEIMENNAANIGMAMKRQHLEKRNNRNQSESGVWRK